MKRKFPDKDLELYLSAIEPKGVAVDLGCGTGADALYLTKVGFDKVYAVDANFEGLIDGAKDCRELEFICSDYEEFIADRKFDFIISRFSAFTNEKIVNIFNSLESKGCLFLKTFTDKIDEEYLKTRLENQYYEIKKYHVQENHPPLGEHKHNVFYMILTKNFDAVL